MCKSCVPKLEGFIESCALRDTWSAQQTYILDLLEAFADRDFGSGDAVDKKGFWHKGVYVHRTCRILTDLDRTAMQLRDFCSELASDDEIVHAIGSAFSKAALSARPTHTATEEDDHGDDGGDVAVDAASVPAGCSYWEHFIDQLSAFPSPVGSVRLFSSSSSSPPPHPPPRPCSPPDPLPLLSSSASSSSSCSSLASEAPIKGPAPP